MAFSDFDRCVKDAADKFRKLDRSIPIRLVSHLDSDGICAAAIISSAAKSEGFIYSLLIVPQLSEDILIKLSKEEFKTIVVTDLGSGQYSMIKKHLSGKTVFILDHHSFEQKEVDKHSENIILVNPHAFGIDGSNEIAGSGVTYFFARSLNEANKKLAHLAVIGAIGDIQEKDGFRGINNDILQSAVEDGKIKVEKGLKWFGIETKPLFKLLAYKTDFILPGISGSESNAVQFLTSLGIEPRTGNDFTKFSDLSDDLKQKFIAGIMMKLASDTDTSYVIGNRYILCDEPESSPCRDAREFSTLLNACGRMDKAIYGIGACLGDENSKLRAFETLSEYKSQIVAGLNWYNKSADIIKGERYIILNAKDKVMPTIIGTIASIISKTEGLATGMKILSLARNQDNTTKVSLRIVGEDADVDLREIVMRITRNSGGNLAAIRMLLEQ